MTLWPLLGHRPLPSLFIPQPCGIGLPTMWRGTFRNERKGPEKEEWKGEEEHRCERVTLMKVADLGRCLPSLCLEIVPSSLASSVYSLVTTRILFPPKYFSFLLRGKSNLQMWSRWLKSRPPILLTPPRILPHCRPFLVIFSPLKFPGTN